jgi:hypothetical protein
MNAFERHGITHLSASSLSTFAAEPAMWGDGATNEAPWAPWGAPRIGARQPRQASSMGC